MASGYARHMAALQGGLVDVAHSLKDDIGGPKVRAYLDELVADYDRQRPVSPADPWFGIDDNTKTQLDLPAVAGPLHKVSETTAYTSYKTYQTRRGIELDFVKNYNPSFSLERTADVLRAYYQKLGKNPEGMVRVPGGRMNGRTAAYEGLRNVKHAAENIRSEALRYEKLYRANTELINNTMTLFMRREQYAGDAQRTRTLNDGIDLRLDKTTIEQRIILTRIFGDDLMGKHKRHKRVAGNTNLPETILAKR